MFALKARLSATAATRAPRPEDEGRFVVPRPLRRAWRFAAFVCAGRIPLPNHIGKSLLLVYALAVGGYGIVRGGHGPEVEQALTSMAGFAIEDVKLAGNQHTSEIDVLQSLGLDGTTSLVAINVDEARRKLAELPWVESVEVRKVYPRTMEVSLKERDAFGIWQHGAELSLIEKTGSVIAPLRDNKFASLPLFVGRDAETAAVAAAEDFAAWPELTRRIKAYVRVASRRWDIYLDNGVVVKLPEDDIAGALARLMQMQGEQKLLDRDIAAVDLRLADRMTVRLTPEADQRRQGVLTTRTKAMAKAEQKT